MAAQPFDDRDGWIWIDGEFKPHREGKVHMLTHAMHYASAVFEGERAYGGTVFKSREHSERLHASARILGFSLPYAPEEIDRAKAELIKKQGLRIAMCARSPGAGPSRGRRGQARRCACRHRGLALGDYFADKMKGIRLMIAPWRRPRPIRRPPIPRRPAFTRSARSPSLRRGSGFDDAMMFDWRGQIAEATGANIFREGRRGAHAIP